MVKLVGQFELGPRLVSLYYDSKKDNGAYFNLVKSTIVLGGFGYPWHQLVGNLVHEAMELAFTDLWARYTPSPDYSEDNGSYLFAMDHTKFSEAAGRAGQFLAECLPHLEKVHKRFNRRKR